MHEEQLARACRKGNKIAQKELFDSYRNSMFSTCMRYASCPDEANDFFQEAFMLVLKKMDKFKYKGKGSLEAWMNRVFINSCITMLRKKKKEVFTLDGFENILPAEGYDSGEESFYPENKYDIVSKTNFTHDQLIEELNKLNEPFRLVFNLHVIEGYKHKEIAEMLSINEKTSKTRLLRAKRMLQQQLYARCLQQQS